MARDWEHRDCRGTYLAGNPECSSMDASRAPKQRSVLESVLAVPIRGSIVPKKDTESKAYVPFGAIPVSERVQFSEGSLTGITRGIWEEMPTFRY